MLGKAVVHWDHFNAKPVQKGKSERLMAKIKATHAQIKSISEQAE